MREIKETCYKGTRILLGNEKRELINRMIEYLLSEGFEEISIPIIQHQLIFEGKVGEENNNLMFNFTDRKFRPICLAPEYTAIIQKLAKTEFKNQKDVKLFYIQECFRGEKPQANRWRQFTQLGVEILNPSFNWMPALIDVASDIILANVQDITIDGEAKRGLDYYKEGKGLEIRSKDGVQLCGGGEYEGGIGFAIGIDRLLLLNGIE